MLLLGKEKKFREGLFPVMASVSDISETVVNLFLLRGITTKKPTIFRPKRYYLEMYGGSKIEISSQEYDAVKSLIFSGKVFSVFS